MIRKSRIQSPEAVDSLVVFCNRVWEQKEVPEQWHESVVACLFKKGDVADCANYRPISLQCVIYKAFASVLLQRLKDAGAEQRIWHTQFAFKSKSGTREALFAMRRIIENIHAAKDGPGILLALDWAKAFDCISTEGMLHALARVGLPPAFIDMVRAIYADRSFQVRDSGRMSDVHAQRFGILQGCPLSPFLFSILMTVLIRDAKDKLHEQFGADRFGALGLDEILYADDTLLMGCDDEVLQAYMQHISDCGTEYGLSFHGTKLESMVVNCTADLVNTAGDVIPQKPALKYLGALLSSEGCDTSEISRRIGMARHELDLLKKCWSHTSLSKTGKCDIYIYIGALCSASCCMALSQPLYMPMTNASWTAFMQIVAVRYFASAAHTLAG